MTILQIEDNPGDARLIREMLRSRPEDFSVSVSERLSEGMQFLGSHQVDIVLLDLYLPDSSGLATLSTVKSQHPHLPVVVTTSLDDEELGMQAVRQGAEDYLVKGQISDRLLRRVLLYSVERRQMAKLVDQERRRLQAVLDALPVGVGIADDQGTLQEMNETLRRIWRGQSDRTRDLSDYSLHRGWFSHNREQLSPEDWTVVRAINGSKPIVGEIIDIERVDGTCGTILNSAAPIIDEVGHVIGGVSVTQDITALRKMEVALRESERDYRLLMEEASDGMLLLDQKGVVITANSRAYELLGYDRGELFSVEAASLVDSAERSALQSAIDQIAAGESATFEHRLPRKDGTYIFVETSARRLADGRFQAIFRDITARKKAEEEFTTAVKTQVFDTLLTALREFRHGEGLAMNLHRLSLFAKNLDMLNEEPEVSRASGAPEDINNSASPELSARERMKVAVEEYRAVGHQRLRTIASLIKAVESELEQKRQSGEQPVSGREVSDLADQLMADMDNLVQRVQTRSADQSETDALSFGTRLAEHIDLLHRRILSISHTLNLHFTSDVSAVITMIAQRFRLHAKDIDIDVSDASHNIHALISPEDLSEVLSSLMNNAVDALSLTDPDVRPQKRKIALRVGESETGVRIVVENNGPPVSPEIRESIFTDGFSTKGTGHGHGLTFVKKHLAKYGARVKYDESFSAGARFCIDLSRA